MSNLKEMLQNFAVESGEIVPGEGADTQLAELLVNEQICATEPTIAETVGNADASEDIAEQLDDLAERADAFAVQQADPTTAVSDAVAEVSIESMRREFSVIMRANKLESTFTASSFEAAGSDADRVVGIGRDARRVAKVTREHANTLKDLSTEGKIMQFLTQDKARLEKAHATLNTSMVKVQRGLDELKDEPKILRHAGIGRWLTVEGKPITNLKKAVEAEAAWLSKANDTVVSALETLASAAAKLKADPEQSADALLPASKFTAINNLSTSKGELLGNITIAGVSDGKKIFKYKRSNEFKLGAFDIAKTVVKGVAGATVLAIGLGAGSAITAAAAGVVGGGTLKSAVLGITEKGDDTDAMSIATPSDLKSVITTILGYGKYLEDFYPKVDAIYNDIDEATGTESTAASKAIADALGRCAELAEILYDQAIYTTTSAATLLNEVA